MVLRFNCPGCRAPYSVADQFAGRTLQCTQCGTAIQIGAPAPQPPPQQIQAQQIQQPQPAGGGLDLLPDDDDPGFRDDEEEEDEVPAAPRRGRSSRQGKISGRQSSGRKTSSRQKRSSGAGRAPRRKSTSSGVATRDCPVCGDEIASVAESCMHCGARLRAPSAASQLPKQIAQLAGPILAVVLVAGGGYFVYSTFIDKPKEPKSVKVKTRKPPKTRDPKSGPQGTPEGKSEPGKTVGSKTEEPEQRPGKTEAPSKTDASKTDATKTDATKTEDPQRTPEPLPDEPEVAAVNGNVLPEGPHKALFQELLDAGDGKPGRQAVLALAKLDSATARPLIEAALQSDDPRYRMRLHRAGLRLGDAATQKEAIESSIKTHKGVKLFWTVVTAIELDPAGHRPSLTSLGFDDDTAAGRALADAALDGGRVSTNHATILKTMFSEGGPELQQTVAPLYVMAGGSEALTAAADALEHPVKPIRELAQRALILASAGQGPDEGASPSDWKEWVRSYQPIRELLGKASVELGELTTASGALERNKALQELVTKGPQALNALPVFLREQAARGEQACRVVAALIVRLATRADLELLLGILAALESHDEAATQVIAAVLVVGDADVAAEAAQAVVKAGIPERRNEEFPDLKRQPRADAVQRIVDWAEGRPDKSRHKGYMLAAAFRPPQLDKSLAAGKHPKNVQIVEVAARIGGSKVEGLLLDVLRGDKKGGFGINAPQDAARRLQQLGTAANSQGPLLKLVNAKEIELPDLPLALSALAPPATARKLKKSLEGWKRPTMILAMQRIYGEIGGEKAVAELGKRFSKLEDGSEKRGLIRVLLELGCSALRDEAVKPFETLKAKSWKGFAMDEGQFRRFYRCAKPEDAAILVEYMKEGRPTKLNFGYCITGIGVMGYKPGLSQVTGFIYQGHIDRARAASSAALLGGGKEDMVSLLESEEVRTRIVAEDQEVLAALSTLDPAAAKSAAQHFIPLLAGGKVTSERALMALSFALAMSNDPGLEKLADVNDPLARAAVARGIAWAAITKSEGIEYPPTLELLRNDADPLVRVEAAIARAYLDHKDAVEDLGRNLPFLTEEQLSVDRVAQSALVDLCNAQKIRSLRANAWHANGFAGGKAPPWRKRLSPGRVWEVEREMR